MCVKDFDIMVVLNCDEFEENLSEIFMFEEMLRILVFECRDFVKVFFVIFIN